MNAKRPPGEQFRPSARMIEAGAASGGDELVVKDDWQCNAGDPVVGQRDD